MKYRLLKYRIKDKYFWLYIMLAILALDLTFLAIKNEFFYRAINYFDSYLSYYVSKYLKGNVNNLIVDNQYLLYIESDVSNIFSAVYIYFVSFSNIFFKILSFLNPIIIFLIINRYLYDDLHNKNIMSQVMRIGPKKYIKNVIIVNSILAIVLLSLPKIIYFLQLLLFFPAGFSAQHFISDASFVSQFFLPTGYATSPYFLIFVDLLLSSFYAICLTMLSIIVISVSKSKAMSYISYCFVLAILSILPMVLSSCPLIFYSSIFTYFDNILVTEKVFIGSPLIIIILFDLLLFFITYFILKKQVDKCL